jgi:predicted Zn-dependent protease
MRRILITLLMVASAAPAYGQIGGILKGAQKAKKAIDIKITEDEERQIGSLVSEKVRQRYGVVQDPAVHEYVSLVGTLLVKSSKRAALPFVFIVLDTDAVNAFAAPGGYVHITRGALALIRSEAELAGVLGHEVEHVVEKHTVKALEKSAATELGTEDLGSGLSGVVMQRLADRTFDAVLAGFGREEELEADREGITLASAVGYAPNGLSAFLTRLTERNKASTGKRGLFASHPQMQERLDQLQKVVARGKLVGTVELEDRYAEHVSYEPGAITEIATVQAGSAGLTGGESAKEPEKTDEKAGEGEPKKKRGFGLGGLMKPGGEEKKSAEVTGSGGARGVDPEVDAKGGSNSAVVTVTITPADLDAFRKGGGLA